MTMLVVGDVILDRYWFGTSTRLSPEAPVPVVDAVREEWRLGGAANVARQLKALGEDVVLAGAIGDDAAGARTTMMLAELGIRAALSVSSERRTTVKHRIIANDHQIARVDDETAHDLTETELADLTDRIAAEVGVTAAIVLSDYAKGVVTPELARTLIDGYRHRGPIVVDTKARCLSRFAGATVLTPNEMELRRATGVENLRQAAQQTLRVLDGGAVLVTQGSRGMTLWRHEHEPLHLDAGARHVADVTGAGDTVTGVLAWGLAHGQTLADASALANEAAAISVGEIGNCFVSREDVSRLAAALQSPLQIPAPRSVQANTAVTTR